jgi:hypothetical protein
MCVFGKGLEVLSPVGGHILQEFYHLYLTRFRTYKIARSPQTKTREGRGPQKDKNLPQSPYRGKFFRLRHFALVSKRLKTIRKGVEVIEN